MSDLKEKSRYSDEELEMFRAIIVSKLEKTQAKFNYYKQQLVDFAESGAGKLKSIDDGTGVTELEHMHELLASEQKFIKHLENALIRIDNKTYGICRETGKLIAKERLMVVPHATLCLDAKMSKK
jgi:RNA polymerase-binding transcription factor DksA